MNQHTCTDCHQPIPNGQAVIRSASFEQVAFHRDCWLRFRAVVRAAMPAQRVAPPPTLSLAERLAAGRAAGR